MTYLYLVLAVISLTIGHLFQTFRWKQFISIYEKPNDRRLLQSLSLGYVFNFYLPLRLGDLFRAYFSGKKMKNGISFSLATIIVGRYLDVLFVGFIFIAFLLFGTYDSVVLESALFYIVAAITVFIFSIFFLKFNKTPKFLIRKLASIFNERIELKILIVFWCFITAFKDVYLRTNRLKLTLNTIIMWTFYLCSYYLLALCLNSFDGVNFQLKDVFMLLFGKSNLDLSLLKFTLLNQTEITIISFVFLFAPLILIFIGSFLFKKGNREVDENLKYFNILPHQNKKDRLIFLENYFSTLNSEILKKYLDITSEILVLEDFSAGSNATTLLCYDDNHNFYRKYVIGKEKEKLYEQVKWLQHHSNSIPLTKMLQHKLTDDYCYYDMEYNPKAVVFFNYIHSAPVDNSWNNLKRVLFDVKENLYSQNVRNAEQHLISSYIDEKVTKNLVRLKDAKLLRELLKYDELIINGKAYRNLHHFDQFLNFDHLYALFKEDRYAEIHGDLTIENIVIVSNHQLEDSYYLIDPNSGNIHESDHLDYAKLLQSLHGGYEFLMKTQHVSIIDNEISYVSTRSSVYVELYERFQTYLAANFSRQEINSIFFHEIVHWLRLLPYKFEKNGERALLFYAGFIIVLNEVIEQYEKK